MQPEFRLTPCCIQVGFGVVRRLECMKLQKVTQTLIQKHFGLYSDFVLLNRIACLGRLLRSTVNVTNGRFCFLDALGLRRCNVDPFVASQNEAVELPPLP